MTMNLPEQESRIAVTDIPERFYEELYSKADILYFRLNDNFQILSCNVTAEDRLITSKDALFQSSLITFITDSCQSDALKSLELCLKKGYLRGFAVQLQAQNGETVHGLMNGLTYENEDGSRFLRIYIQDITEAKELETANRILEFLFHAMQETSGSAVSFHRSFTQKFDCDGCGISLRLKDGESIIEGFWEGSGITEDIGPKDFRRWHPQIWRMMVQKCQKVETGKWTDNGSFWTGYLKETVSILHEQGEKQVFESLTAYASIALISLDVLDQYQGFFVPATTDYGHFFCLTAGRLAGMNILSVFWRIFPRRLYAFIQPGS